MRQLILNKMIRCIGEHRSLACLHRAVGGVRWKSSFRQTPLLSAAPICGLIDEPISIKGHFLPPRCPITVCAQMHSDDGDLWEAFAHYNTDADGTINLTKDDSVGGSYSGCEPMGLFWGLQPSPGSREGLRRVMKTSSLRAKERKNFCGIKPNYELSFAVVAKPNNSTQTLLDIRLRKKDVETPYVVLLSLLKGHVSPSERRSTELAAVITERWYMAPGVRRTEIRQNGIVGTLFLPPGPGPFPAMLDLWGMGGGLVEYRSALFASRGYASLSLAYFGHKDLPGPQDTINVDGSYFKSAFQLLQDHHQISASRVGIIGLSYGVFLALRIATQSDVKPSCLICINGPTGSNFTVSETDGRTETFEGDERYWRYDDQGYVSFKAVSSPENIPPEKTLKVEHITCPLVYIVGEDDQSASSTEVANLIEETLRAAGKSHLYTCFSYPSAGHLIEPPYTPNSRVSLWKVKPRKVMTLWGGHLAPHAAAQEDAWKKILNFMESNLRQ